MNVSLAQECIVITTDKQMTYGLIFTTSTFKTISPFLGVSYFLSFFGGAGGTHFWWAAGPYLTLEIEPKNTVCKVSTAPGPLYNLYSPLGSPFN